MRLHRVKFHDPDQGEALFWFGTKREAQQKLRQLQKDRTHEQQGAEEVEQVEVPTKKEELISWLNTNLDRNNG